MGPVRLGLLDDDFLQRDQPAGFWFKKARTSIPILFALSIVINIGMWFERFVIIVTSLHRDFLPSSWGYFTPTFWDVSCLLGSFGLFFTMFCLFVRFLPMVATAEVKTVLPQPIRTGARPRARSQELPAVADPWRAGAGGRLLMRLDAVRALATDAAREPAPSGAPLRPPRRVRHARRSLSRVRAVRDAGFTRWDAHTPFPVHGLERAMGLRRSPLPWIVLAPG